MAEALSGANCSIKLGTHLISLMGAFTLPGATTDMLESTSFGSTWKTFVPGFRDGGTITFNGFLDPTDTDGQNTLRTLNANNTSVTDIRFYINSNSYYTPGTTNPLSFVYISDWSISSDKAGLVTASFSAKVSGNMVLV